MEHHRPNQTRRAAACATFAALLAVAPLALMQCTMVGESPTGVTIDRSVPTGCVTQCNELYVALFDVEKKRHLAEVERCLAIDVDQLKRDCLQAESARHSAAKDGLSGGRANCLVNCARPGGGSAG